MIIQNLRGVLAMLERRFVDSHTFPVTVSIDGKEHEITHITVRTNNEAKEGEYIHRVMFYCNTKEEPVFYIKS